MARVTFESRLTVPSGTVSRGTLIDWLRSLPTDALVRVSQDSRTDTGGAVTFAATWPKFDDEDRE